MPDTDLKMIMLKLENMDTTLKDHGETLKQLSMILTSIALQDQELGNMKTSIDFLQKRMDVVRDHQSQCPRPQISRLWWTLGVLTALWGATLANFIGHPK